MKVYRGSPPHGYGCVNVRERASGPAPLLSSRTDLLQLSEGELAWGKRCAETGQLAVALLADACDSRTALELHALFSAFVLELLPPRECWSLTDQGIRAWTQRVYAAARAMPGAAA